MFSGTIRACEENQRGDELRKMMHRIFTAGTEARPAPRALNLPK